MAYAQCGLSLSLQLSWTFDLVITFIIARYAQDAPSSYQTGCRPCQQFLTASYSTQILKFG